MSVATQYQAWKSTVIGKSVGNGECVALVVNNPAAYVEYLFPGVPWTSIIPPLAPPNDGAKFMANKGNSYLQWVANDHNNPNQLPPQGAIGVFDATPQTGYTNTYNNPDGHTGIFDSASPSGYALLSQQAGQTAQVNTVAWKFRPCIGWYIPQLGGDTPAPQPPQPVGKILHIAPTTNDMHVYPVGGPYTASAAKGMISPRQFGGLNYDIVADRGNGIYTVNTQDYGQGDLYTKGSDVSIS